MGFQTPLLVAGAVVESELVARGLAPVGLRSSPSPFTIFVCVLSGTLNQADLRVLRTRTGASPLATDKPPCHNKPVKPVRHRPSSAVTGGAAGVGAVRRPYE